MVKRVRLEGNAHDVQDAIAARLAALGEQFMSQFDDYDPKAASKAEGARQKAKAQEKQRKAADSGGNPTKAAGDEHRQSSHANASSSGRQQEQQPQIKAGRARREDVSEIDGLFAAAKPIVKAAAEQRAAALTQSQSARQVQATQLDMRREKKLFMSSKVK